MPGEFAGKMRERIRIERPSGARDAIGSAIPGRILVGEFWATIEAVSPAAESRSESRSAMQGWRFTLHHTDKILPGDTLIWSGREMVVRTVSEDRRLLPRTLLDAEEIR